MTNSREFKCALITGITGSGGSYLAEHIVENFCPKGFIVLDTFGGTGTTLIACEKTARTNRSMELDPKYCDVIVKRWQDFTGKKATLESNGKTFDELKAK